MSDGTDWCRHYQGVDMLCKAGMVPRVVMVQMPLTGAHLYPCFEDDGVPSACPHVSYLTPEERQAAKEASEARVAKYLADLDANTCPFCGEAIAKREQVGRCVYASPCGHRLYQGRV